MAEQATPRRYCVFAGADYYPSGGWHDFRASRDMLGEAVQVGEKLLANPSGDCNWYHVFDLDQRRVVAKSQHQGYGAANAIPDLNK
jgi:hypothetical protein